MTQGVFNEVVEQQTDVLADTGELAAGARLDHEWAICDPAPALHDSVEQRVGRDQPSRRADCGVES